MKLDSITAAIIKDAEKKRENWALFACGCLSVWKSGHAWVVGGGKICGTHSAKKIRGKTYKE